MGGGRVSCSGVYCFLPTCTQCPLSWGLIVYVCHCQCTTITLRMARKIQFKLNYLIVQYCNPAHIWPWYNRHLWITDLVNSKFFSLWVCWTTYLSWKHNSCSRWNQDCRRQHDSAWRDHYLLCIHSTLWFCTFCRRGVFWLLWLANFPLVPWEMFVGSFCSVTCWFGWLINFKHTGMCVFSLAMWKKAFRINGVLL